MMSGLSHVCRSEICFHLRNAERAFRLLECGLRSFSEGCLHGQPRAGRACTGKTRDQR